jgi:5-methylcytosine-specific restriction endonuclease McrA
LKPIETAISLLSIEQPKKGLLNNFFGVMELPAHQRVQLRPLYEQRGPLRNRLNKLKKHEEEIQRSEDELKKVRLRLSRLERAVSRKRKYKDSLIEVRAAAASNAKETREVGTTVRRGLTPQPWCPYCGGALGPDPHADHIYPVSKGGRSAPKNMVYACAKCNIMKTNLTLTNFIQKFSLDRDVIEERLKQLHKDF